MRARAHEGLAAELTTQFDTARVVIATGGPRSRGIADTLAKDLVVFGAQVEVRGGLVGSLAESARLLSHLDEAPATLVVAVGGGQPIDVAKLAAARAGVDLVAVPTTLAHDGMSSPVASLTAADGLRRSVGARMPAGVVIDLDVIAEAPLRYARAGVGDLVSNLSAVDDWRTAALSGGEPFDEFAASIAVLAAQSALELHWPPSADDLEVIARGLVMSGLAMEVAGSSRPCSGAEHLVSHALDQLRGEQAGLHGEHVALGVLVCSGLQESAHTERIQGLFHRVGLPMTLPDAGLDAATMRRAVQLAPETRPGRATILDRVDLGDASVDRIVAAAFGRVAP